MALLQKAYLGATPLFTELSWFEQTSSKQIDASGNVTVTADATAHVKGAWSELVSSTAANASFLVVGVSGLFSNNVNFATLLDIGTGASGSETPLIENIAVGGAQSIVIPIPAKIASGTRISARIQSVRTGGQTATVTLRTFNMGDYDYAPTAFDTIGTSTATSRGTIVTGSSGSWFQLTASSSNAYRAVVVVPATSTDGPGTIVTVTYEVGIGASGSESDIGRTFMDYTNSESALTSNILSPIIAGSFPAGSRIAVRHTLGSAFCDVSLIGIR